MAAELVGSAEIARRLGFAWSEHVSVVRQRDPSFPEPVAQFGQAYAWRWVDVEKWAKRTGRLTTKGRATRPSRKGRSR